jgi:endonuclease/exonuclease/phosphatase family metal-dependent hydrolase
MNLNRIISVFSFGISLLVLFSCGKSYPSKLQVSTYNVENLFDLVDDPLTRDEDFTPEGSQKWSDDRYQAKLQSVGKVFSGMGHPDLIGLSEVENRIVLTELLNVPSLKKANYGVVHYDSPDQRGIDVGLLYKSRLFKVLHSEAIPVDLGPAGDTLPTRDILYVELLLGKKDTFHVLVNHWPSRRGGMEASEPKRMLASQTARTKVQTILKRSPGANIMVMGDFNDTPANASLLNLAKGDGSTTTNLYNPFLDLERRGLGSYNYRGNWDMVDQILISPAFISEQSNWTYKDVQIFKEDWMMFEHPKYGPSPNRTYGGPNYYGGTSDHLPVQVFLKYKK